MQDEDVLFRSFRGIAYTAVAPLIILSASLWFTSDETAYFLAHLGQIYFSIILFFLSANIWSLRYFDNSKFQNELSYISIIPFAAAIIGSLFSFYINPAWGISFLLLFTYSTRHIQFFNVMLSLLEDSYQDLINKISIILCICLMLIFTYWINPYTYPLAIYN
tara:strand:+ start:590 stop:1078 length:489 start_codon:yes stop_codon:yes gene_type:complete